MRDAGTQPGHQHEAHIRKRIGVGIGLEGTGCRERKPQALSDAAIDAGEIWRSHANHGERMAIDGDGLAYDARIRIEANTPLAVAEDHLVMLSVGVLVGTRSEETPHLGLQSEHLEIIAGHQPAAEGLGRRAGRSQVHWRDGEDRGIFQAFVAVADGFVVVEVDRIAFRAVHRCVNKAERARIDDMGIGIKHDGFDPGENGGKRGDAQSQRQDRGQGEPRRVTQLPHGVTHVLKQMVHRSFTQPSRCIEQKPPRSC